LGFIAFMAAALVLILGAADVQRIKVDQGAARRATSECERGSDKTACQSMLIGIRAVVASEEAVRVSIWQSFFSAAGLAGLILTVLYARAAWLETRRAADAATEANMQNAHQSRRELRAYVSINPKNIVFQYRRTSASIEELAIQLFAHIENHGSTPAYSFRYRASFRLSYDGKLPTFTDSEFTNSSPIPPHCAMGGFNFLKWISVERSKLNSESKVYCQIDCQYDDTFGDFQVSSYMGSFGDISSLVSSLEGGSPPLGGVTFLAIPENCKMS
jgi:hypothetical protein